MAVYKGSEGTLQVPRVHRGLPFIPKGSVTKPETAKPLGRPWPDQRDSSGIKGTWPHPLTLWGTLQAQDTLPSEALEGLFRSMDQTTDCWRWLSPTGSGYIGRHGFSLSRSYQQEYSTAYNTQSHIKVVYNGYILTHISN